MRAPAKTPARTELTVPRYQHGVLLKIAYDGRNYSGMAIQDNAITVAGALSAAIAKMTDRASALRVCSRTDAGVHAKGQYVAFDTDSFINTRGWLLGITGELPRDISILSAARVAPGFEPRKHSRQKTYRYLVLQGTIRNPFLESLSWRVSERLNHRLMRREAEALIGTHDFRAFRGRNDFRTHTVRTIRSVEIAPAALEPRVLELTITGNAFLYNMVRIIAGTLVDVGRGKKAPGAVLRALHSGDRLDLGMTAPAGGLYLADIDLSETGFDEWPYHLDGAPVDDELLSSDGSMSSAAD